MCVCVCHHDCVCMLCVLGGGGGMCSVCMLCVCVWGGGMCVVVCVCVCLLAS